MTQNLKDSKVYVGDVEASIQCLSCWSHPAANREVEERAEGDEKRD